MMNRRQFVYAAAGAAMLARSTNVFAATYDLIIKGGRVIDPSLQINAIRDVAIASGRIAAVEANIAAAASETIDARGKLVVPGLVDIHTHATRVKDGPALCLADGVTGFVDAGSQGADHIADTIAIAKSAPQQGRVLINIGRAGILTEGDAKDINRADVAAAREAIARNRDVIIGIKARLSADVAGANDFEVLKRAQEAASSFNLPVMIHMGQTVSPLPKLLSLLKRGDVVTHLFAPPPNSIIDENGHILPEVLAATPARRLVRRRQRPQRSPQMGHCPTRTGPGLFARYIFHRLDSGRTRCAGYRLPERHVEVSGLRNVPRSSDRARNRQCGARI
jgi:dihydroorotase